MIVFVKDEDEILEIPVGLGPNIGPENHELPCPQCETCPYMQLYEQEQEQG